MKIKTTLIVIFLCAAKPAFSQGFINLNFESAVITLDPSSPYYPYAAYASSAVPGWTVTGFLGPNEVLYNTISIGATSVSIFDVDGNGTPPPISGSFSIDLYGGSTGAAASISQSGLVPASAQTLFFKAKPTTGTLQVFLGGQSLSFFTVSTGANYNLYAADISVFANQTQNLTFSALQGVNNYWEIDDIQFSSSSVPEPSTFALSFLGVLFFSWRRWEKQPAQR